MITTKTVLDRVEAYPDGSVNVRWALQVLNGADVISSSWHRACFSVGDDVVSALSNINDNIQGQGFPAIDLADAATIQKARGVFQ